MLHHVNRLLATTTDTGTWSYAISTPESLVADTDGDTIFNSVTTFDNTAVFVIVSGDNITNTTGISFLYSPSVAATLYKQDSDGFRSGSITVGAEDTASSGTYTTNAEVEANRDGTNGDMSGCFLAVGGKSSQATFNASTTALRSTESSGTLTLNVPTHTAGDIMFACFSVNNASTVTSAPSGWTEVVNYTAVNARLTIYTKEASGSEPASYDWGVANATAAISFSVTTT